MLINSTNINFIEKADKIVEAVMFQRTPIILYEKGKEVVNFNRKVLIEVTHSFLASEQVIDASESKIII